MIDHNLAQFGLNENYAGEQVQPSEKGNLTVPSTLRQFIVQANRAYSQSALEAAQDNEGLHLQYHDGDIDHEVPFFHLKLIAQPQGDLASFVANKGNDFFNFVLKTVGRSEVRFVRGNRAAFVGEFTKQVDPDFGEVMVSNILIGTSVFYNDYRVTTNFPASQNELEVVVGDIFTSITQAYPELKVEIEFNVVGEE